MSYLNKTIETVTWLTFRKYCRCYGDLLILLLFILFYFFLTKIFTLLIVGLFLAVISTFFVVKPKYLVGLLFLEIAISGAGRWLTVPGGLSIRILLYAVLFVMAFMLFALGKRKFRQSPFIVPTIIMGVVLPLIWGFGIAVLKGNNISFMLDDCNGQFFYLAFFPLIIILKNKSEIVTVIDIFLWGIFILALLNNFCYLMLIFKVIDINQIDQIVRTTEIGKAYFLQSENIFRLYFKSAIFWQIGLAIVISKLIFDPATRQKKYYYFFLFVVGIALITSFTRGFWVGFFVSLFWILHRINSAKYKLKFGMIFLIISVLSEFVSRCFQFSPALFVWQRLISSFQYSSDFSVQYRVLQLSKGFEQIIQSPILGSGYGKVLEGYQGFAIELGYLDLLIKLGVLGFAIWTFIMVYLFVYFSKITKRMSLGSNKALSIGLIAGMIGLIFTSGTNPFIMSSLGIGYITLMMVFFEMFRKEYGKIKLQN